MQSKSEQINELVERGIAEIVPSKSALTSVLRSSRKLTVYLGIDPTSPELHLGHTPTLLLLRRFQRLGHRVILLLGDFTARIGDPSGRTAKRTPLSDAEVKRNTAALRKQVGAFLGVAPSSNPVHVRYNSAWFSKLQLGEVLDIASHMTVQQMSARDMFQKRIGEGKPVGLHEFLYPLMQGYDSVKLDADVEVGGSDQLFNMLVGRDLVKTYRNKEKFVITMRLLINPVTGAKMSKTEGNLVALAASAVTMYGKIMAFPDELVKECFELCTEVPRSEIGRIMKEAPRQAKARLAHAIVALYHGNKAATAAEQEFERTVGRRGLPSNIPTMSIKETTPVSIVDLLIAANLTRSKSEARRLVKQGGVRIDGKVQRDPDEKVSFSDGAVLQVGKRRFVRLKYA